MKLVYFLIEKPQQFIDMEYKISPEQKEKFTMTVQNFIDSELDKLKEMAESEDGEMSFDETMQIEAIERIKIYDLEKSEKWIIRVDVYTTRPLYYYDDVFYHISYQLKKHIGPNKIVENSMVVTNTTGPGIDW